MKRIKLEGKRFGRWKVVEYVGKRMYRCKCDCGAIKNVNGTNLSSGKTFSCGCGLNKGTTTHGMTQTPEYRSWSKAKGRCYTKTDKRYKHYGGRGIKMCRRWRNSFENFYADMGNRPNNFTLERVNVDGNYEPNNCIWANWKDQQNNRTNNVKIRIGLSIKTIAQWCDIYNISQKTVSSRVKQMGWSYKKAIITPVGGK